jgi:citrate synthase
MAKDVLKEKLFEKIDAHRPRVVNLIKNFGDKPVQEITASQVISGMKGIKALITDISYLDPMEGIRFRGYTIPEVLEKLPKPAGKEQPYVEGHFYLLLTGDLPTEENVADVAAIWKSKRDLPQYVIDVLRALPRDSHPMVMFTAGILAMQRDSKFAEWYNAGKFNKFDAWDYMYEDVMYLLPKLPTLAAYIYRMKYKGDVHIPADSNLDFGGNFAHMMGIPDPYDDVARLYFILHSDHESGNVSAHATHLVASSLSDIFYSYAAGMTGLAGPLHGLANQEVLKWIQEVMDKMGGKLPSKEEAKKFVWDTLNGGQVIPGYGHAVLRKTDPRYMAQREFALKHLPDDPTFQFVSLLYEVVPPILQEHGHAKNPWPNVDAHSGCIQWHYGVQEYDFYTVLFGVGRALGVTSNIIWDRGLGYNIERPKSITTDMLEEIVGAK